MNREQTYRYYKMCETIAMKAGEKGELLKAERWYLEAAKWRLTFKNVHNNGYWNEGHKSRYETCIGNAWIQRQAYEDDKAIDDMSYERGKVKKTKWSVWKRKHNNVGKDSFEALMKKHQKIKKARKSK